MHRAVDELIPLTLLTGFLGSGKTTVLNHLVRQPAFSDVLVIINEFGEIGLDHLLVARAADDAVVEMTSGCLCCSIRGDLVQTVKDLHWRYARGGHRRFSRLIIETTGLADPAPILHTLMTVDFIARRYRLDGILTTVDSVNGQQTLMQHPEAMKQAAVADCLLLTKPDLASAEQLEELDKRLARINPGARQHRVAHGAVDPRKLLDLGLFDGRAKGSDVKAWLNAEAFLGAGGGHRHGEDHVHDGHRHNTEHAHDVNRHDERIQAYCVVIDRPLDPGMVDAWLDLLLAMMGQDMLRIKGVLSLRGEEQPLVIHGVQHIFHPPVRLPAWPEADRRSKIVFITRDIPRAVIDETLDAFLGTWNSRD